MNEIEKLDLIVNHLCSTRNHISHWDVINTLNLRISDDEARYLFIELISDGVVERFGNQDSDEIVQIKYSHLTQKFYDQGGYKELDKLSLASEKEQYEQENIEKGKLINEAKLAKWQRKTFWWLFFLGVIGGICGIVSLIMQSTN
jgi:hypothetical protein